MRQRLPGCFFVAIGSLFPVLGFAMAELQRRAFVEAIEVPAQIVGHEVKVHQDAEGEVMYGPVLKLRYLADGMPEFGEGMFPMDEYSSEDWAQEQLREWPVGKKVTAWASPQALDKAYVVRRASAFPYILILMPTVFVAVGVMFLLFPGGPGKTYTPGTPWAARTFWIVWNASGLAAAAHYFPQPGAFNAPGIALFGIYLGIGAIPLLLAARAWSRGPGRA